MCTAVLGRCRSFVEEHIMPFVSEWEATASESAERAGMNSPLTPQVNKAVPRDTYVKCAEVVVEL